MNNTSLQRGFIPLIIIAIVAAAAIGGGVYYSSAQKKAKVAGGAQVDVNASTTLKANNAASSTAKLPGSNAQYRASMSGLFRLGGSNVCTFRNSIAQGGSSGTAYINGSRIRVDATVMGKTGVPAESHMIRVRDDFYAWSAAQGIKMRIEGLEEEMVQSVPGKFSMDEEVTYECKPWMVDESKFVPPSTVDFIDMQAMLEGQLKNLQQGGTSAGVKVDGSLKVSY